MLQGADTWRNEKLCGRPFSFAPDFDLPLKGKLELDFVEMSDGDGEVVGTQRACRIYVLSFIY